MTFFSFPLLHQLSRAHASKLVGDEDDDDPIVDNNEIDTNNNLDSDWALTVPKTYRSADLRKWRPAAVIQNAYGRPGEMGSYSHCSQRFINFSS